jgi:hypothetical protein
MSYPCIGALPRQLQRLEDRLVRHAYARIYRHSDIYRAVGRERELLSGDVTRQQSRQNSGRQFACDVSRQYSIESTGFFLNVYTLTNLEAPPFFRKLMVTDACFSLSRRRGRRDGETIRP